jgi:ketopantoate hydroxymethyltransferase
MAYSDPQTVTIGATPNTLARVSSGVNTGSFSKDDGTSVLTVSHSYGKRIRRTARVTSTKISADPLLTNVNVRLSASVYIVIDVPNQGYTIAEQKDLVLALTSWLTASTAANTVKLIGGEN